MQALRWANHHSVLDSAERFAVHYLRAGDRELQNSVCLAPRRAFQQKRVLFLNYRLTLRVTVDALVGRAGSFPSGAVLDGLLGFCM